MKKAKSRLKQNKKKKSSFNLFSLLQYYFNHLPCLFLAIVFNGLLYYLVTHVNPSQIKNFLLPNTYLPFLLILFFASWFSISFLMLNSRRGLVITLLLVWIVFLKLQKVIFTQQLIIFSLLPFIVLEIILALTSPSS
ncbi:MAG: hypothetical protein U9O78_00305 [Patescibacteria group bacterium]|nr:hypothetical protein [Patescibacteria group bacterium]